MDEGRGEVCPHCGRTYKDEETLLIHIKIKHKEEAVSSEHMVESIFESDNEEE